MHRPKKVLFGPNGQRMEAPCNLLQIINQERKYEDERHGESGLLCYHFGHA